VLSVDSPLANGTALLNYVEITCNEGVSDNDTAIVYVHSSPLLQIIKTDYPDPVVGGHTLNYTIVVSNVGNENAVDVVVTDVLDALILDVLNADGGTVSEDNEIIWHIPLLSVGNSVEFNIEVEVAPVSANTTIYNFVNATCNHSYAEDDEETLVTPPPSQAYPFLEITKTDKVDPVYYNGEVEYEIVVKNIGDGDATGVVVKDKLDEGVSYIYADPSPYEINGNEIVWHFDELKVGEIITIQLVAKVERFGVLYNIANVTCNEGLYDEDNETTNVLDDKEPPITRKVFHGEVENVTTNGYLLHYISSWTYITLKAVDYPIPGASGVNHTYYRIWKWDENRSKWVLIFDWREYFGEEIYLYELGGYGKYEIEFYSIDKVGNEEKMEWNDVYVYES